MDDHVEQVVLEGGPMSVGGLFKHRRKERGLSQRQLAERVGCSQSLIKQYERDAASPSLEKLVGLLRELDLDPRDLFREAAEPGSVTRREEEAAAPAGFSQRALEELVRSMGGRVTFGDAAAVPEGEAEPEEPEEPEGSEEVALHSLEALRDLVEEKSVRARGLPGLIVRAEEALEVLDLDQFAVLASESGADVGECPAADEIAGLDAGTRVKACEAMQARLIVEVVYGLGLDRLSKEQLDALAEPFRSGDLADAVEIGGGPWFNLREDPLRAEGWLEPEEEFVTRLRDNLPPLLIAAIKVRRPVPVPSLAEETGDGGSGDDKAGDRRGKLWFE